MDSPPESPNLKDVEHLWGHLMTMRTKHSVTQDDLWNIFKSYQILRNYESLRQLQEIMILSCSGPPAILNRTSVFKKWMDGQMDVCMIFVLV